MVLKSVIQDIRFGVRMLRKRPLFTTVAVLTLGLGIGAATAMFSVVDAVLLKALPYRDAGTLVTVWQVVPRWRDVVNLEDYWNKGWLSYEQYRTWIEADNSSLEIAIHDDPGMTLTGVGEPERLAVGEASASLLRVLGVRPALGRWFHSDEEGTEATKSRPVTVLSHEIWQGKFGSNPDVLGTTLTSSERSYTIVGVLPPGFRLRMLTANNDDGKRDVWVPLDADGGFHWEAIGRLAPGVSLEQAEAVAQSILLPAGAASDDLSLRLVPRKRSETLELRAPLILLLGATGLLLLIACANIATLSLGEVLGRRHEIGTRLALGAGRSRIVRQLITESMVLGVLGSIVGAAIAVLGTRLLVVLAPSIPRIDEVVVDIRVLMVAIVLGVAAGLLFGVVAPIVSVRESLAGFVRAAGCTRTARGQGFARGVIAAEIALTVVLLVGVGLLTRSLALLTAVDPGFDSENLVGIRVLPPKGISSSPATELAFFDEVLEQIRATPGVTNATAANGIPFFDGTSSYQLRVEGGWEAFSVSALGYRVAPEYFEVMGLPLLTGRGFTEGDRPGATLVAVVSESMARRCWPRESPLQARFQYLGQVMTVVGVVGDVRHEALDRDPVHAFYVPFAQQSGYGEANFIARTAGDPTHLVPLLREAVWSVDANVPVTRAGSMRSFISQSAMHERYRALLMTIFGVAATVLAAVGVFGVTARSIAQHAREMGIRMALGARELSLVGMTVRSGLVTGLAGTAAGLIGALWTSRLLSRFLFGVEPSDPLTYGVVAVLVVAVCLLASYVPARRITCLDPAGVLRAE